MLDEKPQDKPTEQKEPVAKNQPEPANVNVPVPGQAALLRALRWLKTESPVATSQTPENPQGSLASPGSAPSREALLGVLRRLEAEPTGTTQSPPDDPSQPRVIRKKDR